MRREDYYARKSLSLQFYDIITDLDESIKGDVAFYASMLSSGDSVLDIGCGTGRVSLGLASQGFNVVGVDLAETMIDRARQKQRSLPSHVAQRAQFIVSDVLALALPVRFPLVIIPFYTLNLIKGRRRRADVLKILFRHMRSGAKLIIHCIPVERLKRRRDGVGISETPDVTVNFDNDTRLELLWGTRVVDDQALRTTQAVIYRHRQADGTLIDESQEDLDFSWISDKEINVSAKQAGLLVSETLTGFLPRENGNERIYVLTRPGD